jgi:hypothetical protein
LPEHLTVRGAHLRARIHSELIAEPLPDRLVACQRLLLLAGGGQHENEACLQRLVQGFAQRDLPEQRKYPRRLQAGQGGISRLGNGGNVLLVHCRELVPARPVETQALAARSPPQAQGFDQQIESILRPIIGAGRPCVLQYTAESDQI